MFFLVSEFAEAKFDARFQKLRINMCKSFEA